MSSLKQSPYAAHLAYLQKGQLGYQYSTAADRAVYFPREFCPYTGEDCLEWRLSKGVGTVYSTSSVFPKDGVAYNVALIDLDEGFRMMSRVESIPSEDVKIGMRVQFKTHTPEGDDPYPVFVPVAA
jgi:uncharacterized OB-fold protein